MENRKFVFPDGSIVELVASEEQEPMTATVINHFVVVGLSDIRNDTSETLSLIAKDLANK